MNEVVQLLLSSFDEAYERKAWHGPNLRASLRGVTAAEALKRPGKGRHNIWELAVHAAYWKYIGRRRLTGDRQSKFALKGSNWTIAPSRVSEGDWREVIRLLDIEHRALREAIASVSDATLRDPRSSAFSAASSPTTSTTPARSNSSSGWCGASNRSRFADRRSQERRLSPHVAAIRDLHSAISSGEGVSRGDAENAERVRLDSAPSASPREPESLPPTCSWCRSPRPSSSTSRPAPPSRRARTRRRSFS